MDVTDEWGRKTCVEESIGPFFTNPSNSQLLFSSPSLSPSILSPIPHLSQARFLAVFGVPPSVSSAINADFRLTTPHEDAARVLSYNRLQILPCPGQNSVLVFFPTGANLDQLGFVILSTDDSDGFRVTGSGKGDVFMATERFFSRILKILVQPISPSSTGFGYVMIYTMHSIHWYCVVCDESRGRPVLRYLGPKLFKSCSIVSASWSPHLSGECVALLETGEVFVFDLNQVGCRIRGCKLKVSWEGQEKSVKCTWLGCEFGWRLGMFIVARSDAVFLIGRSSGNCSVRCLIHVESLDMDETEEFVGFVKAGSDFRFILASQSYIFLCDQRSGVPLLKWQHDVENPSFMDVYSLCDLGVRTYDSTTSCVVIGSFWNAESQMFCYGPVDVKDPSSLFVWELPQNLLLPRGKCLCGDCVIREMRVKESLLEWIDWRKKRVLTLGFGILNKHLHPSESSDQSSGFTLIRLTSSGKLEAVKFHASCDPSKSIGVVAHVDSACKSDEVNLLYLPDDNEYKLPKRFRYLELEYLSAHTKGILAELINSKMKIRPSGLQKNKSFSLACHEELCEKLKICGFGRKTTSSNITAVLNNISSPTSVFDIALRETWSSFPIELLLLAFSTYSEFEDVWVDKKKSPLEFLVVPEFPQLPPFFLRKSSSRSSKWSKKEQPGVELVGPVLPLPVLLTLHEFHNGCPNPEEEYSPEAEFSNRCNQISKVTSEVAYSGVDETIIPLGGDRDDDVWLSSDSLRVKKPFITYSPITKTADSDLKQQEEVTKFVTRVRHSNKGGDNDEEVRTRVRHSNKGGDNEEEVRTGLEVFDDMSPVEIGFEDRSVNCNTKKMLMPMTILSRWQHRSSSYKDFLCQYHLHR